MNAVIKGNELTITIPLIEPRPSASGNTLVVATVATTAQVSGQPVITGFNAYIKK